MLAPLGWLLLTVSAPNIVLACALLYFITGVAANGVAIGAGRLLFNSVVPQEKSTAYTSIHYAWLGFSGGIAPLLAGGLLYRRVRPDDSHTTRTAVRSFLNRIAQR